MTRENQKRERHPSITTRRNAIRMLGAGALISSMGRVAAEGNIGSLDEPDDTVEGQPPNSSDKPVQNTCPEGTTLLAKYNLGEGGEFVFEKGRDGLGIDGTELTFSNLETKTSEPGEVLGFDWESDVYDVHSVGVKFGNNVTRWTTDGEQTTGSVDIRERYEGDPVPAISNVIFCIEVHWQVDFGLGPLLTPPAYKSNGRADDLLMAALGQDPESDDYRRNPSISRLDGKPVTVLGDPDQFDISGDTVSVMFSVTGSEPLELHLASFETPGPFEYEETSSQVLFDSREVTLEPGVHQLEISLPTV